jgi:hypothetical protein
MPRPLRSIPSQHRRWSWQGTKIPLAQHPEVLVGAIANARLAIKIGDHTGVVKDPTFTPTLVEFLCRSRRKRLSDSSGRLNQSPGSARIERTRRLFQTSFRSQLKADTDVYQPNSPKTAPCNRLRTRNQPIPEERPPVSLEAIPMDSVRR